MPPRVLLSAYQCAPGQGSVSQIGWEWYSRLAQRAPVTLVTHVRNRADLEAAGAPLPGSQVIYIDTEWFAGPLYFVAKRIFPRSEHSVFLVSSLDFFAYDWTAARLLKPRRAEWDIVHAVTPVSPAAHTNWTKLGLPVVRGPINGGLRSPTNFAEFMKADSSWVYPLRHLAALPRIWVHRGGVPAVTLVANQASEETLTPAERASAVRIPEIAVEPSLYAPTPWPTAPDAEHPLRVLFVGRLVPFKAVPLLLEAAKRVSQRQAVDVVIVGDGPMRGEWEALGDALSDEANGRLRVEFVGAQPSPRIAEELSRAHIFCLPSIRESGGAVLLEAMSAGRPVLAVNYGGPGELVIPKVGELVPASGPAAAIDGLENALLDVAANPEKWRARGEEGRRHVLATHSWDRRIEAGLQIYADILRRPRAREAA
jgi:glycosyltransferase involved in cell wall biosynthesis